MRGGSHTPESLRCCHKGVTGRRFEATGGGGSVKAACHSHRSIVWGHPIEAIYIIYIRPCGLYSNRGIYIIYIMFWIELPYNVAFYKIKTSTKKMP